MAQYYIYAKRPEDKQFKPINGDGLRVTKKDAEVFTSKDEAEGFLHDHSVKDGVELDIRKG